MIPSSAGPQAGPDAAEIMRWAKEEGCTCDLFVIPQPSGIFGMSHSDSECPMQIKQEVFESLRRQGGKVAMLADAIVSGNADIDHVTRNVVDLEGNVLAEFCRVAS